MNIIQQIIIIRFIGQWWGDDSSLNGIRLYCCDYGVVFERKQFSGNWGDWAAPQICRNQIGQVYAVSGMRLKIQPDQGGWDDSAVCGIKIRCRSQSYPIRHYSSHNIQSPWGNWFGWNQLRRNEWMVGLYVKYHDPCGSCDDTALNGIYVVTE